MTRVLRSTNLTNDGRLDLEDVADEVRALAPAKAESLTPAEEGTTSCGESDRAEGQANR